MSLLDTITEPRPQVPPLGTVVRLLGDALGNRFDLAAVEMQETRSQVSVFGLLLGIVACLVLFAGFAFTLTVAALVWESGHRGAWLAGLTGTYLLIGGVTGLILWQRVRAWKPFAETKSQLHQDRQCLQDLSKSIFE